jgi:hypothetical protein
MLASSLLAMMVFWGRVGLYLSFVPTLLLRLAL